MIRFYYEKGSVVNLFVEYYLSYRLHGLTFSTRLRLYFHDGPILSPVKKAIINQNSHWTLSSIVNSLIIPPPLLPHPSKCLADFCIFGHTKNWSFSHAVMVPPNCVFFVTTDEVKYRSRYGFSKVFPKVVINLTSITANKILYAHYPPPSLSQATSCIGPLGLTAPAIFPINNGHSATSVSPHL